jgi:AraC-like DNA-binding protein
MRKLLLLLPLLWSMSAFAVVECGSNQSLFNHATAGAATLYIESSDSFVALRCRFDCYRVERTSSRAGIAPAEVQRLFTAHYYDNYPARLHARESSRKLAPS